MGVHLTLRSIACFPMRLLLVVLLHEFRFFYVILLLREAVGPSTSAPIAHMNSKASANPQFALATAQQCAVQ